MLLKGKLHCCGCVFLVENLSGHATIKGGKHFNSKININMYRILVKFFVQTSGSRPCAHVPLNFNNGINQSFELSVRKIRPITTRPAKANKIYKLSSVYFCACTIVHIMRINVVNIFRSLTWSLVAVEVLTRTAISKVHSLAKYINFRTRKHATRKM